MLTQCIRFALLLSVLGFTSGCHTLLKDSKTETHEYRTTNGQAAFGSLTWPVSQTTKELSEQDLQKAKENR